MRREPASLWGLLKAVLPLAGIWVVYWFLGQRDPLAELSDRLSRLDPYYVVFFTLIAGLVLLPPLFRLVRERRIWMVLKQPFAPVENPFIDIDMHEEAYGHVLLGPRVKIKHVAIAAGKDSIVVRKAAYPKLFPTFEIGWKDVSNVYFVATDNSDLTGEDDVGVARITLGFAEETVLVLPWRQRFNALIPASAGFQEESVV
ncbi:MAG: hypothetical protein AAGE85_15330 [Pseudomonadota bacterium]